MIAPYSRRNFGSLRAGYSDAPRFWRPARVFAFFAIRLSPFLFQFQYQVRLCWRRDILLHAVCILVFSQRLSDVCSHMLCVVGCCPPASGVGGWERFVRNIARNACACACARWHQQHSMYTCSSAIRGCSKTASRRAAGHQLKSAENGGLARSGKRITAAEMERRSGQIRSTRGKRKEGGVFRITAVIHSCFIGSGGGSDGDGGSARHA